MIERSNVKGVFLGKLHRGSKALRGVAIVAEDEGTVNADAMPAEIREGFFKTTPHHVERLVHVFEVCRVQTFKTDQHPLATAPREQFKKLFVVRRVDGGLAHPPNPQRNERPEKLFRLGQVGRDVVVHEEKQFSFVQQRFDLGNNPVNRTPGLTGIENGLHGAEIALEMTAPSRLDQADRQVVLPLKNRTIGFEIDKRRPSGLTVEFFQSAVPGIVNHTRPEQLGLAAYHGFGMFCDLVRAEGRVKSAHDDWHTSPAIRSGDLIRAFRGVGFHTDGNEIGWLIEGDLLHSVIVEANLDILRCQPGKGRRGQRLHLPGADVFLPRLPTDARMDNR